MKRILTLSLALALLLSLAACGKTVSDTLVNTEATAPTSAGPILVTNVDDFLDAIAPGAEILLGEGEFRLDHASNYGAQNPSPYYCWNHLWDTNFELQIRNVDNLTIRGLGKGKTTLITEPRQANILSLEQCSNVTLEDMTMGHTVMAEACDGGVLLLSNSSNTTLKNLGLFGCGTTGVYCSVSRGLNMQDCEVYDCSYSGLFTWDSADINVSSCDFHSLGKDAPVSNVFHFSDGENINITNCMISNNYSQNLAFCDNASNVSFRNNHFTANRLAEAVFSFWEGAVVLEDNVFEDIQTRNWYTAGSLRAVDVAGEEIIFEEDAGKIVPLTPGEVTPVTTGEQKTVHVKNVDDFLKAIDSDTCIILDAPLLDFSTSAGFQAAEKDFAEKPNEFLPTFREEGRHYYWTNNYDGPALIIDSVNNLTIKAEGTDRKAHTISATPRYADVLGFENCSAITLSGFTAGHTKEPGSCTGGVFLFQNCENILVDNCGMYGCGTEGINGQYSRNIQVVNSEIYECSISGIELDKCENVVISGTIIRDIVNDWGDGTFFRFYDSKDITLDGQTLDGNYVGN